MYIVKRAHLTTKHASADSLLAAWIDAKYQPMNESILTLYLAVPKILDELLGVLKGLPYSTLPCTKFFLKSPDGFLPTGMKSKNIMTIFLSFSDEDKDR
jgi:hypothetical protein